MSHNNRETKVNCKCWTEEDDEGTLYFSCGGKWYLDEPEDPNQRFEPMERCPCCGRKVQYIENPRW